MNKWGIIVTPSALGDITVETYVDSPSREAASFVRVIIQAVNRHVRQKAKRDARTDAARKAKRKAYKKLTR
jgi:hypothetical protein